MSASSSIQMPGELSLDLGVRIATQEVARLVSELEPTLTQSQRTKLHMIRLAAESLGAARASQVRQR
jgi:hypothetical protein